MPCEMCNSPMAEDNRFSVSMVDGYRQLICGDCYYDLHTCSSCGRQSAEPLPHTVQGGDLICEACMDNYFSYCSTCGALVPNGEGIEDGENFYCADCHEPADTLHDYDYKPDPIFHGDGREEPFLGVELEIEGGRESGGIRAIKEVFPDEKFAYLKRDGSLDDGGIEVVSHPATLSKHLAAGWSDMMNKVRGEGYTSHKNGHCGLHIHIARSYLGREAEERMIYLIHKFYKEIFLFSRRARYEFNRWSGYHFDRTYIENGLEAEKTVKGGNVALAERQKKREELTAEYNEVKGRLDELEKLWEPLFERIRYVKNALRWEGTPDKLDLIDTAYPEICGKLTTNQILPNRMRVDRVEILRWARGTLSRIKDNVSRELDALYIALNDLRHEMELLDQKLITLLDRCKSADTDDKYLAVNCRHGATIELRFFRGTLKYSTFVASLQLADNLARIVRDHEDIESLTWDDVVGYRENRPELAYYWGSRLAVAKKVADELGDGEAAPFIREGASDADRRTQPWQLGQAVEDAQLAMIRGETPQSRLFPQEQVQAASEEAWRHRTAYGEVPLLTTPGGSYQAVTSDWLAQVGRVRLARSAGIDSYFSSQGEPVATEDTPF